MSTSNFGHLRMSTFMKVDIWSGHLGGVKVDISQAKNLDICATTPHDSHGSGRRASAGDHVGAARLRALANPQLHAPGPSVSGTPYPLHRRTNIPNSADTQAVADNKLARRAGTPEADIFGLRMYRYP